MEDFFLGMPLSSALRLAGESGIRPNVLFTHAPGDESVNGRTARVVAVRADLLIAAYFKDGTPKSGEEA